MTSLSPPLAGIPLAGLQHACLALAAWSTASTLQAETMSVTTLYSAPINPLNAVHPLWTPVQHFHGRTFVVVPDVQLRPMVTQIDRDGAVTTVPLDPGSDYLASTDGHNRFTMGIDPDGYLHIIGDMHGYAWWASTYVERYQYQNLLYWKSNRPLDVSGGFTFAGGVDAATALPGEEWGGDSRFFNDRAGVLYYSSRVRAFTGSRLTGSEPFIAYGIYRYDHTTGLWHSLGGSAAAAVPAASRFNSVLYWEHTTSFEAYQSVPRFDGRNRLHFTIAGNTAGTEGQGLIYAVSDDAGATWKKASGAPIPALPLRGKDGEADQGDLVVRSTKVAQQSAVAIDKDGRIAVKGDDSWRTWDGTAWTPIVGGVGFLGPDGMLTCETGSTLSRTPALGQPAVAFETGFGQVFSMSELGMMSTGAVYAVGLPPGTNFVNATRMSVFQAVFSPARNCATGGTASASSEPLGAGQAFDGNAGSKWYTPAPAPGWLQYAFAPGTRRAVIRYVLTSGNDLPERDPRDWVLQGSQDGTAWEALDARSGEAFSARGQARTFAIAQPKPYAHYRLAISASHGPPAQGLQLAELELIALDESAPPAAPRIVWSKGDHARAWLSWTAVERARTFTVKRAPSPSGPFTVIAEGLTATGDFCDTSCSDGHAYAYVVAGVNAAGSGPDSAPVTISVDLHAARAPIIRTVVGRNARTIISWLPLWPEAASYTVKRATSAAGPFTTIASGITALSYIDAGLTNDATYTYVVSAEGPGGRRSPDSIPQSASPFRWVRLLHYHSVGKDDTGTASASAENLPHEGAAKAFDGALGSKWLMPSSVGWLQYRFAAAEQPVVTRYRLISGQDAPERDPSDWTFEGSPDGQRWVVLDRQTQQAFAGRNAVKAYTIPNTTPCCAYRLNISKNQGNNGLTQLAELELWVDGAVEPASPPAARH